MTCVDVHSMNRVLPREEVVMYKEVRLGFLDSSEKGFEEQIRDFQLYKE